jgi:branched-chain amino acid transport system substrate-binding protein
VVADNQSVVNGATAAAEELITQDQVLVMIGPQASGQAVPAGGIANANACPMISGWSTDPNTTLDRPWVFRTSFLDPFQAPLMAQFAQEELGAENVAVLYDGSTPDSYSATLAKSFRSGAEELGLEVVAFETFNTGETDFRAHLTWIGAAEPDALFVPQFYDEVPWIVRQARELGIEAPIVGSDSWDSAMLMRLCGDDCKELFFSTHFVAGGAPGDFVDGFAAACGYAPTDVGAPTYDALGLVFRAIQDCGEITGELAQDRGCLRDALASVTDYQGVTGPITFTEQGDPIKCAMIARINEEGEFEFYRQVCPDELR